MAKNGLSAAIEALEKTASAREALAQSLSGMSLAELDTPEHDSQIALRDALRAHYGLADNRQLADAVEARALELASMPNNPLGATIAAGQAGKKAESMERALTRYFTDDREPVRAWRPYVERYGSHASDDARNAAVLSGLLALACAGPQAFRTANPHLAQAPNQLARAICLVASSDADHPCPGVSYERARDELTARLVGGAAFASLAAIGDPELEGRLEGLLGTRSPWETTQHLRDAMRLLAQDGESPVGKCIHNAGFEPLAKQLLALALPGTSPLRNSYGGWIEHGSYLADRPEAIPVRTAVLSGLFCRCAANPASTPLVKDEMELKAAVWDEGPLMYLGWALNSLVPVTCHAKVGISAKQAYRYPACEAMGKSGLQATVDSFVKYNYRFVVNDDLAKIRLEMRQSWYGEGGHMTKEEATEGLDTVLRSPANPYLRALWESPDAAVWLGPDAPFDLLACLAGYYRTRGCDTGGLQAFRHRFDHYRTEFVQAKAAPAAREAARKALRLVFLSTMFGPGNDLSHSGTVGVEWECARPISWQVAEVEPEPETGAYQLKDPSGRTFFALSHPAGDHRLASLFDEWNPFVIGRNVTGDQERAGYGIAARELRDADGMVLVEASLYSGTHAKLFFDAGQRLILANASSSLNIRLMRTSGLTTSATDLLPGQRVTLEPGDVFILSAGSTFARPEHRAIDASLFRAYRVSAR